MSTLNPTLNLIPVHLSLVRRRSLLQRCSMLAGPSRQVAAAPLQTARLTIIWARRFLPPMLDPSRCRRCGGSTKRWSTAVAAQSSSHPTPVPPLPASAPRNRKTTRIFSPKAQDRGGSPHRQPLRSRRSPRLPPPPSLSEATFEQFTELLFQAQKTGDFDKVFELWSQVRSVIHEPDPSSTFAFLTNETKYQVMAKFLRIFLLRGVGLDHARADIEGKEILKLVPKPYPVDIGHVLMSSRARIISDEIEQPSSRDVADDDFSFIGSSSPAAITAERRRETLKSLRQLWQDISVKDSKAYTLYIGAIGYLRDLDGVQQAWNAVVQDTQCRELYEAEAGPTTHWPTTVLLNHTLSVLFTFPLAVAADVALQLFRNSLEPGSQIAADLITVNTVLRHFARRGHITEMNTLFAEASKAGFKPDVFTYTTLLQGLLQAGRGDLARGTLDVMQKQDIPPNRRMCSMLVADLARDGTLTGLHHAELLIQEMDNRLGFKPDTVTWTALLAGYFRGGWDADGWDAFERMKQAKVHLNRVAYNVILRQAGLRRSDRTRGDQFAAEREAWSVTLFKQMIHEGVMPNSDTYVIVLGPLCEQRRWEEARWIRDEMLRLGFRPEKGALQSLLRRVERP